jgi:hypothetical protein
VGKRERERDIGEERVGKRGRVVKIERGKEKEREKEREGEG